MLEAQFFILSERTSITIFSLDSLDSHRKLCLQTDKKYQVKASVTYKNYYHVKFDRFNCIQR